jgi:hypothetical protein
MALGEKIANKLSYRCEDIRHIIERPNWTRD